MLCLTGKEINGMVTPEYMVGAVENAFRVFGENDYLMPNRFSCVKDGFTALYMPCCAEGIFGTKLLTLVPENKDRGLPALDGLLLLNDELTGKPLALLDAKTVTAWRTGATGAMAVKWLSRRDASALGVIGCGVQGLHQAKCICAVRPIQRVYLYDAFGVRDSFLEELRASVAESTELIICENSAELAAGSDIIVTTTFSEEPVLPADPELLRGKCYVAVGSYKPEMRELPDCLLSLADRVYIDLPFACEESGDLIDPINKGLLSEQELRLIHTVLGDASAIAAPGETVVFKTVGMALVDIVAGKAVYQAALRAEQGVALAM